MEAFEVFLDRMSKVEKTREMVVGQRHRGDTRAVFTFEGAVCCLESRGYRVCPNNKGRGNTLAQTAWMLLGPEPRDYWWTCWAVDGKDLAKRIAKHYGGRIAETYYPPPTGSWWFFEFDQFEDIIKLVYDRKVTGKFYKLFPETKKMEDEDDGK